MTMAVDDVSEPKPKQRGGAPQKKSVDTAQLPDDASKWPALLEAKKPIPKRRFKVGMAGGKIPAEDINATDSAAAIAEFVKKHELTAHHHRFRAQAY